MTNQLGKDEWIAAGLSALAAEGIEAVRVERLARSLDVTKGSFYWHFKDRKALLHALLKAWQERATADIITEVERQNTTPRARLAALFETVFASDGRLDNQMRAWAASDTQVRTAVRKIDKQRLAYIENNLRELGLTKTDAQARAWLAYHALIGKFALGQETLGQHSRKSSEQLLKAMFKILVPEGR